MKIRFFFIFCLIFVNINSSPIKRIQRIGVGLYKKELKKFGQIKVRQYLFNLALNRSNRTNHFTIFEKPKLINDMLMNDNLLHIQENKLKQLEAKLDKLDDEIGQMNLIDEQMGFLKQQANMSKLRSKDIMDELNKLKDK